MVGRGGHAGDKIAALEDRAAADEPDAGQYAERETQRVHYRKGVLRLAPNGKQQIGLDHCNTSCEPNEHRCAKSGAVATRLPVQPNQRAGNRRQQQPGGDIDPGGIERHHIAEHFQALSGSGYRAGRQTDALPRPDRQPRLFVWLRISKPGLGDGFLPAS